MTCRSNMPPMQLTDENTYVKGQPYTVADVPEDVPTYDEYGNQNGNWTCGDWNDPNEGVMGEQEVSVTATWTFTPQEVADYGVTYVFDTEAPGGTHYEQKVSRIFLRHRQNGESR